eukprot:364282-Chlamydomonas_euryale.AAC.51
MRRAADREGGMQHSCCMWTRAAGAWCLQGRAGGASRDGLITSSMLAGASRDGREAMRMLTQTCVGIHERMLAQTCIDIHACMCACFKMCSIAWALHKTSVCQSLHAATRYLPDHQPSTLCMGIHTLHGGWGPRPRPVPVPASVAYDLAETSL